MTHDSTRKTLTKAHLIERLEHAEAELAQERQLTAALLTMLVAVSRCAGSVPLSVTDDRYLESIRADKVLSTIKVMCRDDAAFVPRPEYIANYVRRLNEVADEPIKYRRWVPSEPSEPVAVIPAPPAPATAAGVIEPAKREPCGCPTTAIYHQAGTCSRPVVGHMVIKRDDTDGWISGGMGEQDEENPELCEGCDAKHVDGAGCPRCARTEVCARCGWCDECRDQTGVPAQSAEPASFPCTVDKCGHIASDHDIGNFANLASRFPCRKCGCTDFSLSSVKVRR